MPIQEKELKGILKSLKAINAALGTVVGSDLSADVQAAISAEGTGNANLDLVITAVGSPAGNDSVAEQSVALWAVLEGT